MDIETGKPNLSTLTQAACRGAKKSLHLALIVILIITIGEPLVRLNLIRKDYTFRCETNLERDEWVSVLNSQRRLSIKQNMGHYEIPSCEIASNALAAKEYEKRLDYEMRDTASNYMEMA